MGTGPFGQQRGYAAALLSCPMAYFESAIGLIRQAPGSVDADVSARNEFVMAPLGVRAVRSFDTGRVMMAAGDDYRRIATEFSAKAQSENDPEQKTEFEILARAYMRLADQAERNSHLDITYETPLRKEADPNLKT